MENAGQENNKCFIPLLSGSSDEDSEISLKVEQNEPHTTRISTAKKLKWGHFGISKHKPVKFINVDVCPEDKTFLTSNYCQLISHKADNFGAMVAQVKIRTNYHEKILKK